MENDKNDKKDKLREEVEDLMNRILNSNKKTKEFEEAYTTEALEASRLLDERVEHLYYHHMLKLSRLESELYLSKPQDPETLNSLTESIRKARTELKVIAFFKSFLDLEKDLKVKELFHEVFISLFNNKDKSLLETVNYSSSFLDSCLYNATFIKGVLSGSMEFVEIENEAPHSTWENKFGYKTSNHLVPDPDKNI